MHRIGQKAGLPVMATISVKIIIQGDIHENVQKNV